MLPRRTVAGWGKKTTGVILAVAATSSRRRFDAAHVEAGSSVEEGAAVLGFLADRFCEEGDGSGVGFLTRLMHNFWGIPPSPLQVLPK